MIELAAKPRPLKVVECQSAEEAENILNELIPDGWQVLNMAFPVVNGKVVYMMMFLKPIKSGIAVPELVMKGN